MIKTNSNQKMLTALVMQFVSKYASVAVQLIITMVLARLLTPEQYGVVAIVTVFLALFQILADMGVSTAIVQYKDLDKSDYDALFFFSLLLGILLTAIFSVLAWPITIVYREPELLPLCIASSLSVLLNTLNMVPNGVLLRRREFKAISLRLVVASLISGVVAVAFALARFGSFSLVAQAATMALVVLIWNWKSSKVSLRGNHRFMGPLRRIVRYSAYQAGFGIINYFARNLDKMLLGATLGAATLGNYDKAYKLMQYPITNLTGIFSSVLQPFLSEYQGDMGKIYTFWLGICRLLAILGCFFGTAFAVFPREVILIMYGSKWVDIWPIVATLSLSIAVQIVNSTSGAIFQSVGRTDFLFESSIQCTGISIVAILIGILTGDVAILGLCVSVAYFFHFGITIRLLVKRVLGVKPLTFLKEFVPPAMVSFGSAMTTLAVGVLFSDISYGASLALKLSVFLASFFVFSGLLGQQKVFRVISDMRYMRGKM